VSKILRLADLGVVVHPRQDWPSVGLSYETKTAKPRYPITFHTTQDRVSADLVAQKARQLRAGEDLPIEVVKIVGRLWVIDGHHTLAAYIREGLPPTLAVHGGGPYQVPAPRYSRRGV
jgi:hypothetical protein